MKKSSQNRRTLKLADEATGTLEEIIQVTTGLVLQGTDFIPDSFCKPVQNAVKAISGGVQAAVRGRLLSEIGKGIEDLKTRGKLIDPVASDYTKDSVTELVDFIESEKTSDTERFKAIKNIFLYGMLNTIEENEKYLSYTFLKIAKQLTGDDILILKACYDLSKEKRILNVAEIWAVEVAIKIGHGLRALIFSREEKLVECCLLGKRMHSDQSGVANSESARLTDLGSKFCNFLNKAESELNLE